MAIISNDNFESYIDGTTIHGQLPPPSSNTSGTWTSGGGGNFLVTAGDGVSGSQSISSVFNGNNTGFHIYPTYGGINTPVSVSAMIKRTSNEVAMGINILRGSSTAGSIYFDFSANTISVDAPGAPGTAIVIEPAATLNTFYLVELEYDTPNAQLRGRVNGGAWSSYISSPYGFNNAIGGIQGYVYQGGGGSSKISTWDDMKMYDYALSNPPLITTSVPITGVTCPVSYPVIYQSTTYNSQAALIAAIGTQFSGYTVVYNNATCSFDLIGTTAFTGTTSIALSYPAVPTPPTFTSYTCVPPVVTCNSAQRDIAINPNGKATSVIVRYGTFYNTYPSATGATNLPAASTDQTYNINLTSLLENTTYYYRVEATNADGVATSAECSFTTSICPIPLPIVSCNPATGVTTSIANINGSYNIGANPTANINFIYGLSASTLNQSTPIITATTTGTTPINYTLTGLLPETTYYYQVKSVTGSNTVTSSTCSFTTKKANVASEYHLPSSTLNCTNLTDCDALLSCNDKRCACGTGSVVLADFNLSESGTISVNGVELKIDATGNSATSHLKIELYDDISNTLYSLFDENIPTVQTNFNPVINSSFGGTFDSLNAFNNLKLKVTFTDVCVNCIQLKMLYTKETKVCDPIPEACCGLPQDLPPFTLAENIELSSTELKMNNASITLDNGDTINIETILGENACGGKLVINRHTRDRLFNQQEIVNYTSFYRTDKNTLVFKLSSRGITPYSPYQSDIRFVKKHKIGDSVEFYYGSAWLGDGHAVFNCSNTEGTPMCYTSRLEYCGATPVPAPTDFQYVLWSDIQALLGGTLPAIPCASDIQRGLVSIATPNEVVLGTAPGVGECPLVLTTQNTGAIFYLGHMATANSDANNILVTSHGSISQLKCGDRFTWTPTQTNTGIMTLGINSIAPLPLTKNSGQPIASGDVVPQQTLDIFYNCANGSFEVISGLKDCCSTTGTATGYKLSIGAGSGGALTGTLADFNGNLVTSMPAGFETHYVSPTNFLGGETVNINSTGNCAVVTDYNLTPIKKNEMLSGKVYELVKHTSGGNCYWIVLNPEVLPLDTSYRKTDVFSDNITSGISWVNAGSGNGYYDIKTYTIPQPPRAADTGKKWVADLKAYASMAATDPVQRARLTLNLLVTKNTGQEIIYDDWHDYVDNFPASTGSPVYSRRASNGENDIDISQNATTNVTLRFYITTSFIPDPNNWATNQQMFPMEDGAKSAYLRYTLHQIDA